MKKKKMIQNIVSNKVVLVLIIIVAMVLIISLFNFIVSIHPPRFYDDATPDDYGMDYRRISFTTDDGLEIRGWLIDSKKANGTVIIGHGYPFDKGNILHVAKFLYPDYNLLFYDHRYFGESDGRITTVGYKEPLDVESAVRAVRKKYGENPVALYGFSLSASAMLMEDEKVDAIVADSPYASLDKMVRQSYRIFGPLKFPFVFTTNFLSVIFFGKTPGSISSAKAVEKSDIPILVIHGEKDSQISVENSRILKKTNPNIELWIVENADHGQAYSLKREEYERKIKDFLRKNMK
ncbi:prolyl oligopeptidase family serine peptidase [Candidatus Pacearchaeota archaeon]|nr:prolyl oligopeptidase family serine peptidase [Candidatus Pacearchaeota archaeon]MBD3283257.1 prolyl oligopeptidase family serine peptidase [Candidatus Pacearchaeota archaeon]